MRQTPHWLHRLCFAGVALVALAGPSACSQAPQSEEDRKIRQLLGQMSIEEKAGQMTQVTLGVLLDDNSDSIRLDPQKLREAIHTHKIGSILNSTGEAFPLSLWQELITAIQDEAQKSPHSIPILYGVDSIHGASYIEGATLFPHNLGIAATRNLQLAAQTARITAMETRAAGIRWNFDPVLDIGRNPLWSRFPETFGEDSVLAGEFGAAVVRAYQAHGLAHPAAVAACAKHFVGYADPVNGKDRTPALIPLIELEERHLPPFQHAIERAGAATVMINSGTLNGVPLHASRYFLSDVLRKRFGFRGVILSDWKDVIRLHERHRIASTPQEAVRLAVGAGLDMSMTPHDFSFAEHLTALVRNGELTEDRLDRSVSRILKLKYELGLFENPRPEPEAAANFGRAEYRQAARQAAAESLTLLKNEGGVLPLSSSATILLAGPTGNNLGALNGSWSFSWQGDKEGNYPDAYRTLLQALRARAGARTILSMSRTDFDDPRNTDTRQLTRLAASADIIVLALGEKAYAESPGSIDDLALDPAQISLAQAAARTGKPLVLVLIEGRPRIVREIVPDMDAILLAYQPGSQGGEAIAEVLFGDRSPGGRLPFSYPRYSGDITPYDHQHSADVQQRSPGKIERGGYRPQWPFGAGLGYAEVKYSNLKLGRQSVEGEQNLEVSLTVTNTDSARPAPHAVEVYLSDLYASISPAVKRLKRFQKLYLAPGEARKVSFTLNREDFSFIGENMKPVVEAGDFRISVGNLSGEFEYTP